jgi:hypothetical protein
LIGGDQVPELSFFPGMDVSSGRKLELFRRALRTLGRSFDLVPMGEHARELLDRDDLMMVEPKE